MQSKQELELQIDKLKDQLRQAELRAEVLAYEGTGIKQEIQDDKAQTAEKLAAGLADRRSDGDAAASSAAACGPVMAPVVLLPVQPPHQRVEGVFNFDLYGKPLTTAGRMALETLTKSGETVGAPGLPADGGDPEIPVEPWRVIYAKNEHVHFKCLLCNKRYDEYVHRQHWNSIQHQAKIRNNVTQGQWMGYDGCVH